MKKRGILIIPFEDIGGDGCGFFTFAAIVIAVALLLAAVAGGFTWLMMGVCWLPVVLEEISWIWVVLIAGVLLAVQMFLAADRDDLSGPIPGSALVVDVALSVIIAVAFAITEGWTDGWVGYVIGTPFFALLLSLMLYPLASFLTTTTALPSVFFNWRYAVGSVCGFLIMVGLVLAIQGAIEGVCSLLSEDLWEMTRLQFTGRWFMLDVTDNAQSMRIGRDVAEWLSQLSAGWRFLVFSAVAGLSIWGRIAVASDDL